MIQIVSDSSTLYSVSQAKEKGLYSVPLSVSINKNSYREFEELTSSQLLTMIQDGQIPSSSQPSIGEKLNLYNELAKDNQVIDITMADGLSGTYQSALMAKDTCEYSENVTVFNSKTLCGPHRALVDQALNMRDANCSHEEIMHMLVESVKTEISFLIPFDFQFLMRGGRVSKASANLGGLLRLIVCMKKSDEGKTLEKHSISRTLKKAIKSIFDEFDKHDVDDDYIFSISHAFNEEVALEIEKAIRKKFEKAKIILYPLSPVFITQGGPGCCAIQAIKIIK